MGFCLPIGAKTTVRLMFLENPEKEIS